VPAPLPVKKPFPWWIIAVISGVIIVGIILAVVLSPKEVEVPNLVGSPLIAAQPTLEASGLKVNIVQATAPSAQQNRVIAQNPASGAKVQNGSAITLSVGVLAPSPTPTPTATPTSVPPTNTPTSTAVPTDTPTPTAVPPTDTPTPTATATPDRQTTTQLTSSPAGSAARGQSVSLTAQITTNDGNAATGTVSFVREGGAAIAGCTNVPVTGGKSVCTTGGLTLGAHAVTVTYSGDTAHNGSTSSPLSFTITAANTSISISAGSSYNGIPVWRYTASATVNNTSSGVALTPAGTITFNFTDGGAVNDGKACTLNASGSCSVDFTTSLIYYRVSATYNPSTGDFNSSSSGQVGTGR
jgi:hypothetical protein